MAHSYYYDHFLLFEQVDHDFKEKPFEIVVVQKGTNKVMGSNRVYMGGAAGRFGRVRICLIDNISLEADKLTMDDIEWYVQDQDGRYSLDRQRAVVIKEPRIETHKVPRYKTEPVFLKEETPFEDLLAEKRKKREMKPVANDAIVSGVQTAFASMKAQLLRELSGDSQ